MSKIHTSRQLNKIIDTRNTEDLEKLAVRTVSEKDFHFVDGFSDGFSEVNVPATIQLADQNAFNDGVYLGMKLSNKKFANQKLFVGTGFLNSDVYYFLSTDLRTLLKKIESLPVGKISKLYSKPNPKKLLEDIKHLPSNVRSVVKKKIKR